MAEFRHIVRIADTDLKGDKQILVAMKKIKGVDVLYANAALSIAGVAKDTKAGDLMDSEIKKIEDVIKNPAKYRVPDWLLNKRKEYESGEDMHLLGSDLVFSVDNDIKRMKKNKTYKGLRHQWGLTVRGQRTKANFRKNKGKGLGVKRKK